MELDQFIEYHDTFLLFGHEDPDADCICSQIVFASYLRSLGKTAHVFAVLPFTRIELQPFTGHCIPEFSPLYVSGKTASILLDCSHPARTGIFSNAAKSCPMAVIDHHDSAEISPDIPSIIDSKAPSTTYLVFNYLERKKHLPGPAESSMLFLGLCTDTGFFRHLGTDSGDALRAAARLCDLGASPNKAFHSIYGSRTIGSRKFLGLMLSRAESHFSGRLLTVQEKLSDLSLYSRMDRDTDMLYQLLLGTRGVEIIAFFREEEGGKCSVSLRTRGDADLSRIAADFGGGGHRKASGYTAFSGINEAMESFFEYAEKYMSQKSQ